MGRARGRGTNSSSSSSIDSNNHFYVSNRDLTTDLRLGLPFIPGSGEQQPYEWRGAEEGNECNSNSNSNSAATFFVKVNMEGIPIGRKIDLLALDGYHDLIRTLDLMFNTTILWAEEDGFCSHKTHVLTYEDKEGDWLMVGDVPWEMFLSSARRLKISRPFCSL